MRHSSEIKVGLLVLASIGVLAVAILLIGEQSNLFRRKNSYFIRFATVSGLNKGNPVQLNGVDVGSVHRIVLPQDPSQTKIEVWIDVDRRYAARIRKDSMARIKTLGLLGDKYVEVTSGSPEAPEIGDGEEIPAAPATSVDKLLATGEDVMDNVVSITFSLRKILTRMEQGKGLLGELTTESETGKRVTDSLVATLESVQRVADEVDRGAGPLPRLIHDRELADHLEESVTRLDSLLAKAEGGEGLLPGLLNDPETKARFDQTLTALEATVKDLKSFTGELEKGEGLIPKLLGDEQYGRDVARNLKELLERLNEISAKLDNGDGSAARLINDPEIYQSLNDILIGINESWMLRWLIRNRQKAGIESRYKEERKDLEKKPEEPPTTPPPGGEPTTGSSPQSPRDTSGGPPGTGGETDQGRVTKAEGGSIAP